MAGQYDVGAEPVPGYRLDKLLGRGHFGDVWKAFGPGGTEVALRVMPIVGRSIARKIHDLRLITNIKHPNLVPILALWLKDRDGNFLDLAPGQKPQAPLAEIVVATGLNEHSLADRLRECHRAGLPGVPVEELLDYMDDAARGIDHLNQANFDLGSGPAALPHCNIKPANILVVGGAAQVSDFGLATMLGRNPYSPDFPPHYLAPELFLTNRPSSASDQYGLAISYIELRTGALPFQPGLPAAIVAAHVRGLLDLSRLSEPEQEVIRRAAAVDPTARFPRTVDMVRALRRALNPCDVESASTSRLDAEPKRAEDRQLWVDKGVEIVPGYKLIRQLGRGGYGEVWEASAPGNLRIALKLVKNLEANTGRQEFKALQLIKNISHVHLLALHAYWLLDATGEVIADELVGTPESPPPALLVLATRLADKNLLQRLRECQKAGERGIPPAELIEYMRQAATAIDFLNAPRHVYGDRRISITHRDIKPENILLSSDVAIVADFGLAKLLEGADARVSTDSVGLTLLYAAPEMLQGTISFRSDQYSLALTYYHMRTGSVPFPRDINPYTLIQAHLKGMLQLHLLPDSEREVIVRGTQLDPQDRWPSCVAMVRALEEAMVAARILAAPVGPPLAEVPVPSHANMEVPAYMAEYETFLPPPRDTPPPPVPVVRSPAAEPAAAGTGRRAAPVPPTKVLKAHQAAGGDAVNLGDRAAVAALGPASLATVKPAVSEAGAARSGIVPAAPPRRRWGLLVLLLLVVLLAAAAVVGRDYWLRWLRPAPPDAAGRLAGAIAKVG